MPITFTRSAVIRGITSCVPATKFDNLGDSTDFDKDEIEKVVAMTGVKTRHLADESTCSSDLCLAAAKDLLQGLQWSPETVDLVIMVTQSPDYFLPSTACLIHRELGLRHGCAAFDVGLGCSGYPYGLCLAATMLQLPGFKRGLLLHGETPARFANRSDRSVALLFGDAGSATALEATDASDDARWWFDLHTDGSGYADLIMRGGGFRNRFPADCQDQFVEMNGKNIFNFTIKRVPSLIEETLAAAEMTPEHIDYFIFHQSNRFIMRHLAKKVGLPEEKTPQTIAEFGSAGGPSVPLTITRGNLKRPANHELRLLLLGYGVGLSWASALITLPPDATLNHLELGSLMTTS